MINVSEMNHITLTIIIPCYNVESYLPACLACIESQSYKNFRCILVDDGSTDATGAICDELVKKDSRFQVLHIQNSGSSVPGGEAWSYVIRNM